MIIVNGEPRELTGTVDDLLDALGVETRRGLAVAIDATVVPRGEWATTRVGESAVGYTAVSAMVPLKKLLVGWSGQPPRLSPPTRQ